MSSRAILSPPLPEGYISRVRLAVFAMLFAASGAFASEPPVQTLVEQAKVALEQGRHEESLELLNAAYAREANPVFLQYMAKVLGALDRHDEALVLYQRLLAAGLPAELRRVAEDEIAEVSARAQVAWVRFPRAPASATVKVGDTKIAARGPAREAVSGGYAWVTVVLPEAEEMVLRRAHFPAGYPSDQTEDFACVSFDDGWIATGPLAIASLEVNGERVVAPPRGYRVRVQRGVWTLRAKLEGGAEAAWSGEIAPSETASLGAVDRRIVEAAPPAAGPGSGGPRAEGSAARWPIALAGAGGALAGVGAVLLAMAHVDADPLARAASAGSSPLTRAEAESLASRVDREGTAGVLLLGGGIAALAAVTAWLVLEE